SFSHRRTLPPLLPPQINPSPSLSFFIPLSLSISNFHVHYISWICSSAHPKFIITIKKKQRFLLFTSLSVLHKFLPSSIHIIRFIADIGMRRSRTSLKREFLKKWMLALQLCNHNNKTKSVAERKKTIKLSAEIAIATARNGDTCWSRALIANAAKSDVAKPFLSLITKQQQQQQQCASSGQGITLNDYSKRPKTMRCKKIVKRSCGIQRRRRNDIVVAPEKVAKRMARRKTELLKKIVPGGEFISDDEALIRETLDYMVSLRAQVQVMRSLVRVVASDFQGNI
ncbi:Transcription factor IBH1-like 1, partial [Linum grandiflorum]